MEKTKRKMMEGEVSEDDDVYESKDPAKSIDVFQSSFGISPKIEYID